MQQHFEITPSTKSFVNAKTTGAIGDGQTDDTQAIQSALNKINQAGGGVLYIPAGNLPQTGDSELSPIAEVGLLMAVLAGTAATGAAKLRKKEF